MTCQVSSDLNNYLKEVDRQDTMSGAVDMLADQWLSHPSKIQAAWMSVLQDPAQVTIVADLLTHSSLRSGRFLGFSEEAAQSLLIDSLSDMMLSELKDMAHDQLTSDAEQNAVDSALSALED